MDDHLRCLRIEKMCANHIEEIVEIEKLCFSRPWSYEALAEELSNPLAVFFVAVIGSRVVGYAGMHHIIDEGYITNIAVHPDFRRNGIATALVEKLDAYAKKECLSMLTLEVRQSNAAAINIYKRAGFDSEGLRKGFYDAPKENAVIMTKYYKRGVSLL